jgi:anti-sigma factor RsiW
LGKFVESGGETYVTCEEVITFLLDYLTRELSSEEQAEFDRHLAICPSCKAYLETYKQAVRLGREALRDELGQVPPAFAAELVRALGRARS